MNRLLMRRPRKHACKSFRKVDRHTARLSYSLEQTEHAILTKCHDIQSMVHAHVVVSFCNQISAAMGAAAVPKLGVRAHIVRALKWYSWMPDKSHRLQQYHFFAKMCCLN